MSWSYSVFCSFRVFFTMPIHVSFCLPRSFGSGNRAKLRATFADVSSWNVIKWPNQCKYFSPMTFDQGLIFVAEHTLSLLMLLDHLIFKHAVLRRFRWKELMLCFRVSVNVHVYVSVDVFLWVFIVVEENTAYVCVCVCVCECMCVYGLTWPYLVRCQGWPRSSFQMPPSLRTS